MADNGETGDEMALEVAGGVRGDVRQVQVGIDHVEVWQSG